MSITVNIQAPKVFESLLLTIGETRRIGIETSPMNSRMPEILVSLLFWDLVEGKTVALFGPNLQRSRTQFLRLCQEHDIKLRRYGPTTYSYLNGTVHFQQGTEVLPDDLSFYSVSRFYGIDCHRVQTDLSQLFDTECILAGVFTDSEHWHYHFCRNPVTKLFRYDAEDICSAFPDQKRNLLPKHHPFYQRHMKLKDIETIWNTSTFMSFSRTRLKIKSDKPLVMFTKKQQDEATGQHGAPVVTFDLSALQRRYMAAKRLGIMKGKRPWYILLKYRRGGYTTLEQALSYFMCISRPRSSVITLAHTSGSTKRIFRIASMYQQKDPQRQQLEGESKSELEFQNGSVFFIGTAGGKGVARGDTLDRVHGSEVSKWCIGPNQITDVTDLAAGLLGAASNGEVVLESTPNGREWFWSQYTDAKKGLNDFTPIFLRWFDDPINRGVSGTYNPEEILETLDAKEENLIELHGLDIAQIAFRRTSKKTYGRLFEQEMPEDDESCFITSGTCFFDVEILLSMLERIPQDEDNPDITIKRHGEYGYEKIWEEPNKHEDYVLGVDTSEGLPGCDRSGLGVISKTTGRQVCSLHGYFNPRKLADHVVRIGKHYNHALIGIERENHGHAVIQRVVDLKYSKPHFRGGPLYYYQKAGDISNSKAGWTTNGQTRPVMLDELSEAIENGHMKTFDRDLLDECLSFRLQNSGKFEADSGAHDDSVMKWAIAWQMYRVKRPKPSIAVL